ncbi:class I SAM-dependent methyltransferase [Amycolatopsis sp. NPDC021455]|uniref:class I SAM-dependent methyltransferase n=1 Tax=Amycolatopsis sp. NPDC021455 TaxID=3154901 RepID=UPI00340C844C
MPDTHEGDARVDSTGTLTGGAGEAGKHEVRLGAVQQTLFIPLVSRARETNRWGPVLRDPKAVELVRAIGYDTKYAEVPGGWGPVLRTAVFDTYAREFLARHPAGTVVELGTGLNTRFERLDNGRLHWFDLDLPDTIELRRAFFEDTGRRRMITASALDEEWLDVVAGSPGPYLFVTEGMLAYFSEEDVHGLLTRIVRRFPGSFVVLDTYSRQMIERQQAMAAARNVSAMTWACDDPGTLEHLGLELIDSATITKPPRAMRRKLPLRYRIKLPLADREYGKAGRIAFFRVP